MRRPTVMGTTAAVVAAAVVLLVWSPWSGSTAPQQALGFMNPSQNTAGIDMPSVGQGQSWVYDLGYPLCTTAGPVTVTSIEPEKPHGSMRVTGWSIGAPANTLGARGTVAEYAGAVSHPAITWACHGHEPFERGMITVSVELHGATAIAFGFTVGDRAGASALVPFVVKECVAADCPHTAH